MATPAGVIHGVAFSVNGAFVSCSDNSTASLAAGASRTVTANACGISWTAGAAGNYMVEAVVDDINRIAESNETNNRFSKTLTVSSFISLEAESGTITAPMQIYSNANASGGSYIAVAPGNNSTSAAPSTGKASYSFSVPSAGAYKIWGRVLTPTNADDSFWVRVDGGNWINWNNITLFTSWGWDDVHDANNANTAVTFSLSAGTHSLEVAYREDGTMLDKLLITDNLSYTPGSSARVGFEAAAEKTASPAILLSPNPATDRVTLKLDGVGAVAVKITDLQGRILLSKQLSGEPVLNVAHLAGGLYVVHLTVGGRAVTQKLLIQR